MSWIGVLWPKLCPGRPLLQIQTMLEHMSPFDFLPYSFQDDLIFPPAPTSSRSSSTPRSIKDMDMFIQNSLCKCPLRRDIITWDINLDDHVGKEAFPDSFFISQ